VSAPQGSPSDPLDGSIGGDDIASLLGLMAERAAILHGLDSEGDGAGGDIDCAVAGMEGLWPLRLDGSWSLCQCLHYDLRGWYWVLERRGAVIALDVIEDPRGLGRDGYPTEFALANEGIAAGAPERAVYLTAKRIRKGIREEGEWKSIGALAAEDPARYAAGLQQVFGGAAGLRLSQAVVAGVPPTDLWRQARLSQLRRRLRTPLAPILAPALGVARLAERISRPTGLVVLVAGPDGSGKSTVARELANGSSGMFRRSRMFHWRPGLLPRPGAMFGVEESDTTKPHDRPAHGKALSLALLGYYWVDFLLGGWTRILPVRSRSGLVVVERGWWDIAVDPARYRLQVSPTIVQALGALLPKPDVALLLQAPPEELHRRKAELQIDELERQQKEWTQVLPRFVDVVRVDVRADQSQVARTIQKHVVRHLERRAASRLGAGWASLPVLGTPRWMVPRGPNRVARSALAIYQPVTPKARLGWEMARLLAGAGGFRLLPRGNAPPRPVRVAVASYIPRGGTLAVMRANHPGRYLALVLDRSGMCIAVAKVATTADQASILDFEAESILRARALLDGPVFPPTIMGRDDRSLVLAPVEWKPRRAPWEVPEEVARAMGHLFRAGSDPSRLAGPAHGDFAPWNLLEKDGGWVLLDWESFRADAPPFFDFFHYIVQGHVLLGRPSQDSIMDGLHGIGWIGRGIRAYADGAGVPADDCRDGLAHYLEESISSIRRSHADQRAALGARRRLLTAALRS
jgi:hypothetical protein